MEGVREGGREKGGGEEKEGGERKMEKGRERRRGDSEEGKRKGAKRCIKKCCIDMSTCTLIAMRIGNIAG